MKKILICAGALAVLTAIGFWLFPEQYGDVESGIEPYVIDYPAKAVGSSGVADSGVKTVYLTFDDGPEKYTPEVLDILDKYGVSATFFVVGDTEYTAYMKDIAQRGHTIGLHSYDHNFEKIYRSSSAFFADLDKIEKIVFEQTGIHSKIMRFPGGSSVRRGATRAVMRQLCSQVQDAGFAYFDWNCESGDKAGVRTVSGVMRQIRNTDKDAGSIVIVLMHDTEKVTVSSLPGIIEYFKEKGAEFETLSPAAPAIHHSWAG